MNLTISNLTKAYLGKKVLDIPKLEIEKGFIHSIIGPNGAGKSTLIKTIAGIEKHDSGSITYDGQTMDSHVQKKITLIFQKPYMLDTTVYNNIAYPLKIRKAEKSTIEKRVSGLLSELDLDDIKSQNALTLSGGEAQKVALARALVFRPDLVLLDEPTANIDPVSTLQMERLVLDANVKFGISFLWITHNINQARRTSAKVTLMYKGKAVEYGDTKKVLANPQHEVTKRFISGELII